MNLNDVPTVVLVASGKGGVGKTTVAADLAQAARDGGYTVGLIDGDISTPNSPQVLGGEEVDTEGQRLSTHDAIVPPEVNGVQLVSQGVILPDDVPVLRDGEWRARSVADFIEHVEWNDGTDVVFIDTPPGTGEELQVIVSAAAPDHAYVVTTPHPSSVRDATKTHEFFEQASVSHETVINMAYIPGEEVAAAALSRADLQSVDGVGEAKGEELRGAIHEAVTDYPLFGYDGEEQVDVGSDVVAVVPYTESSAERRQVYSGALDELLAAPEVEA